MQEGLESGTTETVGMRDLSVGWTHSITAVAKVSGGYCPVLNPSYTKPFKETSAHMDSLRF